MEAPTLAAALGVGQVWVKDESSRFGLPSFKMLGASWATYRAVVERLGDEPPHWNRLAKLRAALAAVRPMTLAAATDGNHGRAVARMARWLGFGARIFVPAGTARARITAIEGEGAQVHVVDGTYDDAVARSAADVGERCLVISDTSWPGYERVLRWVIEGYSTIFWEVQESATRGFYLVVVPVGVGALAAATVRHYRRPEIEALPMLVGVEPTRAACVAASLRAGRLVTVPGPHDSIMAGLNCGRPSYVAWPYLTHGLDAVVAIGDEPAAEAMRELARIGVVSGETGAAALGGLTELVRGGEAVRGVGPDSRVLLLSSEGATDPEAYRRIIAKRGASPGRLRRYQAGGVPGCPVSVHGSAFSRAARAISSGDGSFA